MGKRLVDFYGNEEGSRGNPPLTHGLHVLDAAIKLNRYHQEVGATSLNCRLTSPDGRSAIPYPFDVILYDSTNTLAIDVSKFHAVEQMKQKYDDRRVQLQVMQVGNKLMTELCTGIAKLPKL